MNTASLVSTVYNEFPGILDTIADINNQTRFPDEVIVVDAGSTDGTWEALQDWKKTASFNVCLIQELRCNVAKGRNIAIKNASFDIIVSTDFGCRIDKKWFETLVSYFEDNSIYVVGGNYKVIESDLTTMPAKANYILTNGYKVNLDHVFTPTSRSIAYRKYVWEKIGGYAEWLTLAADDTLFGRQIKKFRFNLVYDVNPMVSWGRHTTVSGYAKESYRYGLGDGECRINKRSAISLTIENLFRYSFFATLILTFFISNTMFVLLIPFSIGLRSYFRTFLYFLKLRSNKYNTFVFIYSLVLLETNRFNYLKGFFSGYFLSDQTIKLKAGKLGIS